ncbi:MAG: HAMP domain-containing histidine kinase [Clostridia bacterium]|nr:HAMP domain-containing histidine kinase [Clostridia bacterium]
MLKQLRIKFVCITMLIITVMIGIIMGLVIHFTAENMETQSVQLMRTVALSPPQPDIPGGFTVQSPISYCTVYTGRYGEVIRVGGNYDISENESFGQIVLTAFASEDDSGTIKEHGLRFMRMPQPNGFAFIFADISFEQSMMSNLVRNCILIGLASLVALFFVSVLLARWAIKPVEQAWKQQRQFVSDASHELKTPLTVISTNAELLQSESDSKADVSRLSQNIQTMTRQMRSLVEGMLDLARIDNGTVRTTFTSIDMSELVRDTVLPFEAVFFERQLLLDCQIEDGIFLTGSRQHLARLVEIFLDNAQKYSYPDTQVTVSLKRTGRAQCLLSVSNYGDEIGTEDLKNIFKRFYRADKARTRDGSYGLGLSIAEGIVNDHRGEIWAESADGVNTFFVKLAVNTHN